MSEALPERVWKDFGLPNGLPKQVLEASSRPSKTSSLQLGLPGGLQNGFWTPFGPLEAGFWTIFGGNLSLKIVSEVCLSLQFCIVCRRGPNAWNFFSKQRSAIEVGFLLMLYVISPEIQDFLSWPTSLDLPGLA